MFTHVRCLASTPKLESETIDGKRYYVSPEGVKMPSVTTVLSILDKDGIAEWKKKVGEDVANYISRVATTNGTNLHSMIEDYLANKDLSRYKRLITKAHFDNIKPYLDRINNIAGQEVALYSNELKLAGKTDCVAEFDGVLSIIDFKTSSKEKREEWLKKYFLQETCYSMMWEERTGQSVPQIVTIITAEDGWNSAIVKDPNNYKSELLEVIDLFKSQNISSLHADSYF